MHGTSIEKVLQKTQTHSSLSAPGPIEQFHGIADT